MNLKLKVAFICMAALQTVGFAYQTKADSSKGCVILIHGLGRTSVSMKRLEWTLARAGYQIVNVSYPSRRFSVQRLAEEYLHEAIAETISAQSGKVHFVTHSMGGIVLRQYLSNHPMKNLGSVVMLAPPNQGSEVADSFKRNVIGRWILGPGGCELGTASTDLPKQLVAIHFDLGVIVGNRSFNPLLSRILHGPNDGKVSVKSAQVEGMSHFLVVPNSHTWMMWRLKTIQQVLVYLKEGRFNSLIDLHDGRTT
jgi:triacylglycerol lipase